MRPNNDMRTTTILSDLLIKLRDGEIIKVIFTDTISGERITFELYPASKAIYMTREAL